MSTERLPEHPRVREHEAGSAERQKEVQQRARSSPHWTVLWKPITSSPGNERGKTNAANRWMPCKDDNRGNRGNEEGNHAAERRRAVAVETNQMKVNIGNRSPTDVQTRNVKQFAKVFKSVE